MRNSLTLISVIILLFMQNKMKAQSWETPIIEGYGKIVHYENAEIQPDPSKDYKIIFHIKDSKQREGVNEGLWKIARLINLMGSYNVPLNKLHIVAVVSGSATPLVLNDVAYAREHETQNPNLLLLEKLSAYQVKILVCGQALAKHQINATSDLNPFVKVTVSALTAIPHYQMEGFVPMF